MPTETKNSTAKASRSGRTLLRPLVGSSSISPRHAGEESAERERHAEQLGRAEGDAERDREHAEPEQLARPGMRDIVQEPRDHAPADDQHERDEGGDLGERDGDDAAMPGRCRAAREARAALGCRRPPSDAGERRHEHQRQDHGEVLDDQPADGDPAAFGLDEPRAPAAPSAARRCSRPTAPARRRGRRQATSPRACAERPRRARWRRRSARSRRGPRCRAP